MRGTEPRIKSKTGSGTLLTISIENLKDAARKGLFFSGPATKRGGGGGKGLASKKKYLLLIEKKIEFFLWPLSSRGLGH